MRKKQFFQKRLFRCDLKKMLRKIDILEDMRKKTFFQINLKKYFPSKC